MMQRIHKIIWMPKGPLYAVDLHVVGWGEGPWVLVKQFEAS